ncbi:type II secretion system ATPase GspE [Pseudofulvimonas gallinarii]|jgi:general secretion pathway protein E|uniref:Type II secretion system protein E n=1 Tax=Pseudofulvimonas gallinarii TaxID=634155 RepID=A0A4V2UWR1_9GAMM|nr:type II secretion system ATPase GspE [Pseudofulvimonas gallinarii]TCT00368.1 type II secretion system protein E (GspE) [Pseudofulvimonas gallinarii]THD12324.1 type II secretion system protein GspE [Pseudofulvimonas gallinarii]
MSAVLPESEFHPAPPGTGEHEAHICAVLVERGRLKETDLARARRLHEESGGSLVALLTRLGLASERDVAEAIATVLDLPLKSSKDAPESPPENIQLPLRFLKQHHVVPIAEGENTVELLVADPQEDYPVQAVGLATGRTVQVAVALRSEIDDLIERYYGQGRSALGTIVESLSEDGSRGEDDVEHLRDLASEAPVIRLVNIIIQRAVEGRASDIHIEPFENRLKVRYRIDGVLHEVESPPASSTAAVISRVKIMAKLNIAERRLPQDGRIMLRVQGKELDLRVSTVPTAHGESVVMRILDRESVVFDFKKLGFTDHFLPRFLKVLELPHGIMLVTGPTGSGKTTTLYTALSQLNTPDVKIITVEDPVEYQIEGINQIQAKAQIGLDFAQALRSIVRQDPDVIMIGEMRDLETAKIAIQSALTGHLVLSTLHTNSAAGGVTRLLDMGVDDYLLASTVNGILAQRLVRRLDAEHAQAYTPSPEVIQQYQLERYCEGRTPQLYRPMPSALTPTGYFGRTTIMEFLTMTEPLRRLIMQHADELKLQAQAQADGMRTMFEDGVAKSLDGLTTIEEVLRVTQES